MTRHTQPLLLRVLIPIAVGIFGLLPSFLLFFWFERNMALPVLGPWLAQNLGPYGTWPLLFLDTGMLGWIAFDVLLIALFGLIHSGLAALKVSRPLYVIAAGLSSLMILLFWQKTGVVLYQLIPSAMTSSILSALLFWGFAFAAGSVITRGEGALAFLGLKPRAPERDIPFKADGLYAYVRHPGYLLTILAWFLTPMLSLDRLVFGLAMTTYLVVGMHLEERKLIARFGDTYRAYQKRVPMILPRLKN